MATSDAFPAVFERLRAILKPYESHLLVKADTKEKYVLDAPPSPRYPQYPDGVFVGGVEIKKRYVSYYLMPVYVHAELLQNISAPLRKRMQGKSCFNFTRIDDDLLAELEDLTTRSVDLFVRELAVESSSAAQARSEL
jgi:hypothetical protein